MFGLRNKSGDPTCNTKPIVIVLGFSIQQELQKWANHLLLWRTLTISFSASYIIQILIAKIWLHALMLERFDLVFWLRFWLQAFTFKWNGSEGE